MTDYYICPSDTTETTLENGTIQNPWKMETNFWGSVSPGDELRLLPNFGATKFSETFTFGVSGDSNDLVFVTTAPGESIFAKIESPGGSGIFSNGYDYLSFKNLNLYNCSSIGLNLAAGSTNIIIDDIYSKNNGSTGVRVSANNGKDSNNIVIKNSILTGNGGDAVWLTWGDADVGESGIIYSVDVINSILSDNDGYGVRTFSADETNEKAYDILVDSNTIQRNGLAGVIFKAMLNTSGENKISRNTISENSTLGTLGGVHIGLCSSPIVEDNLIYNNHTNGIDGRGLYFDNGSTDFRGRRNIVSGHVDNTTPPNNSSGIAVTGGTIFSNGILTENVVSGNYTGMTVGGTLDPVVEMYQNTVMDNLDRGISIQNNAIASAVTAKNNIIAGNTTYGFYNDDAVNEPVIDYNCWYDNGTDLYQIAAKGANSISLDPLLTSTGKLSAGSPAENSGLVIAGINNNKELDPWGTFTNGTPNIGADQYSQRFTSSSRGNKHNIAQWRT